MPTALITGASGGIGLELARRFAARAHDLVLVARSEERLAARAAELAAAHGVQAHVVATDLARPGAGRALHEEVGRRGLRVDRLVNNAGFGTFGAFLELDLGLELQQIGLNVVTLTELCKLFGRDLAARGEGGILNVASTAAFQAGPRMAVYYASKAYVLHFSEALAEELAGAGVQVTALCPGPTRTGFHDRARMQRARLLRRERLVMDAAEVAEEGVRRHLAGDVVVVPGLANRVGVVLARLAPRRLVRRAVRDLNEDGA